MISTLKNDGEQLFMILKTIMEIGKSIKEDVTDTLEELQRHSPNLGSDIIHYIREEYGYSKKCKNYIVVKIAINPFISRLNEFLDKCSRNTNLTELISDDLIKIKLNKNKRQEIFERLYSKVDPNLIIDLQQKAIKVELRDFDYNEFDDIKLLLGNQHGTTIFYSPVMYQSVSKSLVTELPMWKIKLSTEDKVNSSFFDKLPTITEYNTITKISSECIRKVFISDIFLSVINDYLKDIGLKSSKYYIVFLLGKGNLQEVKDYPYEIESFVDYYNSKISGTDEGPRGLCELCLEKKPVIPGPKSKIGFYTDDPKGNVPIHLNNTYTICKECNSYLIAGRNFIKSNLRFKLANRGTKRKPKNPLFAYFIPYTDDNDNLSEILNFFKILEKKDKEGLEGLVRKEIITNEFLYVMESRMNEDDHRIIQDSLDFLMIPFKLHFSLLIIIFYHPEGQASSFHSVKRIIYLNSNDIDRINNAYKKLKDRNRTFSLKSLFYLFGEYKIEKYILSFLELRKMNKRILYKDAYMMLKRGFLRDALNPDKTSTIRPTMFTFTSFLYLLKELKLL